MRIVLLIIAMPIILSAAIAGISAAPWIPTKPKQRRDLLNLLDLDNNDICYDLGCGDGSVLFEIARKHPKIKCIGYEISILPLLIGKIRKTLSAKKYKNVSIRFGNLFKKDFSDADVIFVFLLQKAYPKLIKTFQQGLKPNARIAVEAWPIPNVKYTKKIKKENLLPIYIYKGSDFS